MLLIALTIFFGRNINRLIVENEKYEFNPFKNPVYRINDSYFSIQNKINCDPSINSCDLGNGIIAKKENGFKIFFRKQR